MALGHTLKGLAVVVVIIRWPVQAGRDFVFLELPVPGMFWDVPYYQWSGVVRPAEFLIR